MIIRNQEKYYRCSLETEKPVLFDRAFFKMLLRTMSSALETNGVEITRTSIDIGFDVTYESVDEFLEIFTDTEDANIEWKVWYHDNQDGYFICESFAWASPAFGTKPKIEFTAKHKNTGIGMDICEAIKAGVSEYLDEKKRLTEVATQAKRPFYKTKLFWEIAAAVATVLAGIATVIMLFLR